MKRFFLVVLVVVLSISPVFASENSEKSKKSEKFKKGSIGIGGMFSLSADLSSNWSSLTIIPEVSYFAVDNFCLDLTLGYSLYWRKNHETSSYHWTGFGARYFYKKFYTGLTIWNVDNADYRYDNYRDSKLMVRAGRLFSIAKNVYLNTELNYDFAGNLNFKTGFSIILKKSN